MDNLYWLDQIQSTDCPLVGEKAFYLSTLLQQGYPVVNGFVVPAPSFREFLETIHWSEPLGLDLPHSSLHLDVDNPRQLQRVSQKIRQEIMAAALPESWISKLHSAVEALFERESLADAPRVEQHKHAHRANESEKSTPTTTLLQCSPSTALGASPGFLPQNGLYEPHICPPGVEALSLSLKQTWADLFRARSLFYWQRAGIGLQQMNLAVLVQPLLPCVASGTLQSDTTGFSIQATWGLSHALSKGEVIPDSFRVEAETGAVQSQKLGSKTLAYGLAGLSSVHLPSYTLPYPTGDSTGYGNAKGEAHRDDFVVRAPYSPDEHVGDRRSSGIIVHGSWPTANHNQQSTINNEQFSVLNDYLQAYLLSEEQQKQYALEEKYLQQLIGLAQQLRIELGTVFSLEWTLSLPGEGKEPSLYLTQITEAPSSRGAQDLLSRGSQEILSGGSQDLLSWGENRSKFSSAQEPKSPRAQEPKSPKAPLVKGLAAAAGRTMAKAQVISGFSKNVKAIPSGRVLVTKSVTPDWLPLLKRSAGIVAELGGMTCHAAIIARELGIPAIVGAAGATQLIKTGEFVLVDGDQGVISRCVDNREWVIGNGEESNQSPIPNSQFPIPNSQSPIATQLLVNLSQPSNIERAAALPVDGVGLLRSELMMLEALENQHPIWWVQQGRQRELLQTLSEHICQFAKVFSPRPVFYRSLDLRSHEFQSLFGGTTAHPETNPMLGMRGTFSYLSDPTLFDLELAALAQVQQSGYTNVHLLLPFVRTVEEFSFCRSRAIAAGLTQYGHFQIWIMAEVPSVLFLLPDYVKAGVQGVSIGTNDLTQLLLGVDRDQAQMERAFDERHPAVLQAIRSIIQLARTSGIPCSICGLAPGRFTEIIDHLVLAGITSISVELDAVERTYTAIARCEQRLLLEAARRQLGHH